MPGGWSLALVAVGPALAWWDGGFRCVPRWSRTSGPTTTSSGSTGGSSPCTGAAIAARRGPSGSIARCSGPSRCTRTLRYALGPAYASSGLPVLLPSHLGLALRPAVDALALALVTALLAVAAAAWRRGSLRPGPQHLLILIVGAFHAAVFARLGDPLLITATLTIFHNLQYHRIVWHYEAGKGRRPLGGALPYLAAGVAFGACWYGARVVGAVLAGPTPLGNALLGLGWGVALHHYLVDGRIWRVRRSPGVAAALESTAAPRFQALAAGGAQG